VCVCVRVCVCVCACARARVSVYVFVYVWGGMQYTRVSKRVKWSLVAILKQHGLGISTKTENNTKMQVQMS